MPAGEPATKDELAAPLDSQMQSSSNSLYGSNMGIEEPVEGDVAEKVAEESTPGFGALFTFSGLMGIAFLLQGGKS